VKRRFALAPLRRELTILKSRLTVNGPALETTPIALRNNDLSLRLAAHEREVFVVLFLDAQHRPVACGELFRGTLTKSSAYPLEVLKAALQRNAAARIIAHKTR